MMFAPLLVGALALSLAQQTDTTFAVPADGRLDLDNPGGLVLVRAWDRSAMRVQASHSSRARIAASITGSVVKLDSRSERGHPGVVDYEISVPAGLSLKLGGLYADIEVENVRGEIVASTVHGSVVVRGAAGRVQVDAVGGRVEVEGGRGRVFAKSINGKVSVRNASGEVVAESVSGSVELAGIDARTVTAATVSGSVRFEGVIHDGGRYSLITHSGSVNAEVQPNPNVSVTAATFSGSFNTSFSYTPPDGRRQGRRHNFQIGSGSATLEMETFSGSISLRDRGTTTRNR